MEHEAYEKGWFTLLAMSQGPNPPNQPIRPWSSPDLNNLNIYIYIYIYILDRLLDRLLVGPSHSFYL